MKKNRLPHWIVPVLLLLGLGLLTTGVISYFVASQSTSVTLPSSDSKSSPTQPTDVPVASSTLAPLSTDTPLPSPSPTVEQIIPDPTSTAQEIDKTSPVTEATTNLIFNGESAYKQVLAQVAIGPRPTGSEAGWATGDFIMAELQKADWLVEGQEFFFKGVKGRNVIGRKGSGPVIILGAHYDTRPAADMDPVETARTQWIEGGNDGASGAAVLLELAQVLETEKLKNEIWLAFFDAEDRGRLDGWPFSVGARHMAENLTISPQAVIVIDMIGDADQQLYYEHNSTAALSVEVWAVAAELGYQDHFIPEFRHTIIDDHLPFVERLIPAIDIIDFDYPYWHTIEDTADKVAPASLERVGRTLEVWVEEKQ